MNRLGLKYLLRYLTMKRVGRRDARDARLHSLTAAEPHLSRWRYAKFVVADDALGTENQDEKESQREDNFLTTLRNLKSGPPNVKAAFKRS
jgi:hypothetical protein